MTVPRRAGAVVLTRLLKLLLLSCAAFYVVICVLMAVYQRSFIYSPPVHSREQVDAMAHEAGLERWVNAAGQFIGMKRLSPKQPANGTILITHGNGGSAIRCSGYVDEIQAVAAFDVFILEYPGYEDRGGSPSQSSLFRSADEALLSLPAKNPVYLVGESLGTGVASYLAGTYSNRIAGVLLISPFNSVLDVAQGRFPILPVPLLLIDRFHSDQYLRNYHGKVGITLDGRDRVVPAKLGYRLFDGYSGPKRLWKFPTGTHCQITERPAMFWKEVIEFWQNDQQSDTKGSLK